MLVLNHRISSFGHLNQYGYTKDMKKVDNQLVVVTRTKDRPLFLKRAIKSVASQTSKDFVHVIVNDNGDKSTVEDVVEKHKGSGYETKIVHVNTNGKMEQASNAGVTAVDTKYVAVHDDDDTWHPECVEQALKKLESSNNPGVVVRTNKIVEKIDEANTSIDIVKESEWMPDMKAINLYRQCIENQMTPITFIYKRAVYDEIGGYDEELPVMGDWDFGIRFLTKYDIDFLDPGFALANYHHRKFKAGAQGNTSYSGNDKKVIYGNYLMNKYLREEFKSGRIGPGYIMSKTKYDQNFMIRMISKILPGSMGRSFLQRYKR